MGKFYRANEEFKAYLLTIGFTFHDREEETISYFTHHETGKQVKVNTEKGLVTLLDNYGHLVDESSSYTDNQIIKFLEN